MTAHRRGYRRADGAVTRAAAQASPGAWVLAATYPVGGSSMEAVIRDIRAGRRGYGPPGAYDARALPYGQDDTALEVRYLGGGKDTHQGESTRPRPAGPDTGCAL